MSPHIVKIVGLDTAPIEESTDPSGLFTGLILRATVCVCGFVPSAAVILTDRGLRAGYEALRRTRTDTSLSTLKRSISTPLTETSGLSVTSNRAVRYRPHPSRPSNTRGGARRPSPRAHRRALCNIMVLYTTSCCTRHSLREHRSPLRQRSVTRRPLWDIAHVGFLEETSATGVYHSVRRAPGPLLQTLIDVLHLSVAWPNFQMSENSYCVLVPI